MSEKEKFYRVLRFGLYGLYVFLLVGLLIAFCAALCF